MKRRHDTGPRCGQERVRDLLGSARIEGPSPDLRARTLAGVREALEGGSGRRAALRSWWPDLLLATALLAAVLAAATRDPSGIDPVAPAPAPLGLAALAELTGLESSSLRRAGIQIFPQRPRRFAAEQIATPIPRTSSHDEPDAPLHGPFGA